MELQFGDGLVRGYLRINSVWTYPRNSYVRMELIQVGAVTQNGHDEKCTPIWRYLRMDLRMQILEFGCLAAIFEVRLD
jgi:hypothetical protein